MSSARIALPPQMEAALLVFTTLLSKMDHVPAIQTHSTRLLLLLNVRLAIFATLPASLVLGLLLLSA